MNANTRIRDVQMLTNDGSIIIAEDASKTTEESNTQIYFRALYNRIEVILNTHVLIKYCFFKVEAHFHEFVLGHRPELEPPMQPIRGQIGLVCLLNSLFLI